MFTHHPVFPIHVVHYHLPRFFQRLGFYDEYRSLCVGSRLAANRRGGFIRVSDYTGDSCKSQDYKPMSDQSIPRRERIRAENTIVYTWLYIREVSLPHFKSLRNVVRVVGCIYEKLLRGRGTSGHEASTGSLKHRTLGNLTKAEHPLKFRVLNSSFSHLYKVGTHAVNPKMSQDREC